jgi:hypothetical protein
MDDSDANLAGWEEKPSYDTDWLNAYVSGAKCGYDSGLFLTLLVRSFFGNTTTHSLVHLINSHDASIAWI